MTSDQHDHMLAGNIVMSDHEWRVTRRKADLYPGEVIVLLSMAQLDQVQDLDAKAIVDQLPRMGRDFFTVQGSFLHLKRETLVADTQQALKKALRLSPDGDFVPLVASVLTQVENADDGDLPAWKGLTADLLTNMVFDCWVSSEVCKLKRVPEELEHTFTVAVHQTINDYWDYVDTLE